MLAKLTPLVFFIVVGIGWRFVKPQGITAESLQKTLHGVLHYALLPVSVFFIIHDLPLNHAALKILIYVLLTTAITLAVAWFWLSKTNLQGKTKGALLIASGFGNVFFLGMSVNHLFFPNWTARVAVEYALVANIILLSTVGAVLARSLVESGKDRFSKAFAVMKDYRTWVYEPLLWAGVLGLLAKLVGLEKPEWLGAIEAYVYAAVIPLLLLPTALALNWNQQWNQKVVSILPAAAIQLVLAPLIMWGCVSLFGSAGFRTTQTLLLDSMMPASLLGFAACQRYNLDGTTYAVAFAVTTALAIVTVPIMSAIML